MDGWQLLYSVSVPIILAIPRFGSLAVLNSAAVTCRHLRHFGNFRGAGFGLAPTSLGLAPTGRRLPEGSGGQGTQIPTIGAKIPTKSVQKPATHRKAKSHTDHNKAHPL